MGQLFSTLFVTTMYAVLIAACTMWGLLWCVVVIASLIILTYERDVL